MTLLLLPNYLKGFCSSGQNPNKISNVYLNPLFWKLSYTRERNTSLVSSIAGDGEEE